MRLLTFIQLVTICTAAHVIRVIYEILKHRKKIIPGRLTFAVIFTDMFLLWASWFILCPADPFKINIPVVLRYAGVLLVVSGLVLFLTALFTIKTLESYDGKLITNGIYSWLRHPMYLAFIFWLFGPALYFRSGVSLILAIIYMMNILYWRYLEELELVIRFPGYSVYRESTIF